MVDPRTINFVDVDLVSAYQPLAIVIAVDEINCHCKVTFAGDLKGALSSKKQSLAILEEWYQRKSDDLVAKIFVARGYDRLDEALGRLGERQAALENFHRSIELAEQALARDSSNKVVRQELALTYFRIGEICFTLAQHSRVPARESFEQLSEARRTYQRSLDLLLELRRQAHSRQRMLPNPINHVIRLAIARNITSCSFIARSTAVGVICFMTASCHVALTPPLQIGHFMC